MTRNEKLQKTYEQKREQKTKAMEERKHQIDVLREIRDDPNASPADRLKAVELLKAYHAA